MEIILLGSQMKEFYSQYFLLIWPASERAAILCLSLRIWHMCWETLPQGHRAGGTLVLGSTLWTLAWWLMESPQTIHSFFAGCSLLICKGTLSIWFFRVSSAQPFSLLQFQKRNPRDISSGTLSVNAKDHDHFLDFDHSISNFHADTWWYFSDTGNCPVL